MICSTNRSARRMIDSILLQPHYNRCDDDANVNRGFLQSLICNENLNESILQKTKAIFLNFSQLGHVQY